MQTDLIVKNIEKHIKLSEHEKDLLFSFLKPQTIPRRQFLLRAGEVCRHESFVTKGCLRTYFVDDQGLEHITMFAIEDWWTADMFSLVTQRPAIFHIDALEDSEVLQIEKNDLETLYREAPRFERFFRIIIQYGYVASQYRIVQNLAFTAEERYMYFREKYPGLELRIPQKQVAAFLGITPEFLSTLRKKIARP